LYFPTILYSTVMQPMSHDRGNFKWRKKLTYTENYSTGQAEAVRMALAHTMCEVNAENRFIWNQKVY
jgi:ribosomal protein S9